MHKAGPCPGVCMSKRWLGAARLAGLGRRRAFLVLSLLGKQDIRYGRTQIFSSFLHMYKRSPLLDIKESYQDNGNFYFGRKWHVAYKRHED